MIVKRTLGTRAGEEVKSQLLPDTGERGTIIYCFIKLNVFQIKSAGRGQEAYYL